MAEIVYLLTNPTMPGLVKIGFANNLEERMRSLSGGTGVPLPFECFYACEVENKKEVESALHEAFGDHRINPKREFFRINPSRIQAILKLLAKKDVTPTTEITDTPEELEALHKEQKRAERFNFKMVGLSPGVTLKFIQDESVTATIVDERNVEFEGKITSTSNAAVIVLQRKGQKLTQAQGPAYWTYDGKTLVELRQELEEGVE